MKKIISVFVLLALCTALLCSCGVNIKGTWVSQGEILGTTVTAAKYTFNGDGTYSVEGALGITTNGTYTVDGDTVTMTTSIVGIETTTEYTATIEKDVLTLTDKNGVKIVLEKE